MEEDPGDESDERSDGTAAAVSVPCACTASKAVKRSLKRRYSVMGECICFA